MGDYVRDNTLVLDLLSARADGGKPLSNTSSNRNIWVNLSDCDPFYFNLVNFLFTDGCGWTGDGTVNNPYGLAFNILSSNAYASATLFGNLVKPANAAFSVEVWAKVDATCPDNAGIVAMHGYTGTSPRGWHLRVSNGKALFYRYVSADQTVSSNTSINDGTIKHIVAIYNGSGNAYIYINGQLDNDATGWNTGAIVYTNSYPLYIGAWNVSSLVYLQGTIYAVRFYLRELGPSEILQNYNAGIVDNVIGFEIKDEAIKDILEYIKNNWRLVEIIDTNGNVVARLNVDDTNRYWNVYKGKVVLVCKIKGSELSSIPVFINRARIYKDQNSLTPFCDGVCNAIPFMSVNDEKELDFVVRLQ